MSKNAQINKIICKNCKNSNIIYDFITSEYICSNCGYVSDERNDEAPRINVQKFMENNNYKSINNNIIEYRRTLNTVIPYKLRDAKREFIKDTKTTHKLRKYNNQLINSREIIESKVVNIIKTLAEKLNLTSIFINRISYYYEKVTKDKITKGRAIPDLLSACVYVVCKEYNILKELKDICNTINADCKLAFRYYRLIKNKYKVNDKSKIINKDLGNEFTIKDQHLFYINKLSSDLELDHKVIKLCYDIINFIYDKCPIELEGKKPLANVATIIYIACTEFDKNIRQYELSSITNISSVSIRKKDKYLREILYKYGFKYNEKHII